MVNNPLDVFFNTVSKNFIENLSSDTDTERLAYNSLFLLLLWLDIIFSYFNNFCPDFHYFSPPTAFEIGFVLLIQCLKDHCELIYLKITLILK